MDIKAKENSRLGDEVLVDFSLGEKTDSRYVKAADWDADPQAIIAERYAFLIEEPAKPIPILTPNPIELKMTPTEAIDKNELIRQIKLTEDAEVQVFNYETAPITTLDEVVFAESLKKPADTAVALLSSDEQKLIFQDRIDRREVEIAQARVDLEK